MKQLKFLTASLAVAGLLAACGDSVDQSRGTLLSLTSTGTLTTSDINAQVLAVSGATPPCTTVNLHHFEYYTVGGVGEATTASGGIMTPQGNDPACQGERPVLLYAHGTTLEKNKNMASRTDSESNLIAATFAMHGYIVCRAQLCRLRHIQSGLSPLSGGRPTIKRYDRRPQRCAYRAFTTGRYSQQQAVCIGLFTRRSCRLGHCPCHAICQHDCQCCCADVWALQPGGIWRCRVWQPSQRRGHGIHALAHHRLSEDLSRYLPSAL